MEKYILTGKIIERCFGDNLDVLSLSGWDIYGKHYYDEPLKEILLSRVDHTYDEEDDIILSEVFKEILLNKVVTVRYFISKIKRNSVEEAQENFIKQLYGIVDAEYRDHYSELTGYLWTDENLDVGGHDLLNELSSFINKYLIMEIKIEK